VNHTKKKNLQKTISPAKWDTTDGFGAFGRSTLPLLGTTSPCWRHMHLHYSSLVNKTLQILLRTSIRSPRQTNATLPLMNYMTSAVLRNNSILTGALHRKKQVDIHLTVANKGNICVQATQRMSASWLKTPSSKEICRKPTLNTGVVKYQQVFFLLQTP